jgi:flagellar export protein FliJ
MEIKEKLLEQKQRELEIALMLQAAVVKEIRSVEEESTRTYNDMATRCITGKELSMLTGYLSYLDMSKKRLYNKKMEHEKRAVALRNALLSLEMELKVLEKLRSRAFQRMKKARNRKEQKLMDDIALRGEGK